MFIDTATANNWSGRPQTVISDRTSPYNESSTPILETFVGQDAPPTYLEATTPGLYSSRLYGEEGTRLLSFDGREPSDAISKEDKYNEKSIREKCLRWKWLRWFAAVLAVVLLLAMLALIMAGVVVRKEKQVRKNRRYREAQN